MKTNNFLLLTTCLFSLSTAEMHVGGILHRDTRWNAEDGPFHVTSDILVPYGVRLTISPGAVFIIGQLFISDTTIKQLDCNDSEMISIKIEGALSCTGKRDNRIIFKPDTLNKKHPAWYGIILNLAEDQFTDVAFTDITGAHSGLTIIMCSPAIRNLLIEYNHIGIKCIDHGSAIVSNCTIVHNRNSGIRVVNANPQFTSNIIASNRNNGIWGDGVSMIKFTYNCISGNNDGNFLDCDPELGHNTKMNEYGDSVDIYNNLLSDPVFSGSVAELKAREKDVTVPTEKSSIRNNLIAAIIHNQKKEQQFPESGNRNSRYYLSRYSPCINSGNPAKKYDDTDGSRNDMGIYGGPDLIANE